jgi:hypothetical protein
MVVIGRAADARQGVNRVRLPPIGQWEIRAPLRSCELPVNTESSATCWLPAGAIDAATPKLGRLQQSFSALTIDARALAGAGRPRHGIAINELNYNFDSHYNSD